MKRGGLGASLYRTVGVIAVAWLAAAGQPAAGATLLVRAVAASSGPSQIDAALRDVEPLLKRQLQFTQFRLTGSATVTLPADGAPVKLGQDLVARCRGDLDRLSVTIEHKDRVVVQTQVGLRRGSPLVFAGLTGRDSTTLVVIVAR